MYYCAQGQSRRWHIGDWFLAYRVLRGFSRGSHVGYPIPPPSPPPIKIRSVIIGMSRDIFRPSFMYEAPITIGRRIIETSASIDRQPRYRQLLRPCADSNVRSKKCVAIPFPPLLISSKFRLDFPARWTIFDGHLFGVHILEIWFFSFFLFPTSTFEFDCSVDRNFVRDILHFSWNREYIFFFEHFVRNGKEK